MTHCDPPAWRNIKPRFIFNERRHILLIITAKLKFSNLLQSFWRYILYQHTAFGRYGTPDGVKLARDSNKQHSWETENIGEGIMNEVFSPETGYTWQGKPAPPSISLRRGLEHLRQDYTITAWSCCVQMDGHCLTPPMSAFPHPSHPAAFMGL